MATFVPDRKTSDKDLREMLEQILLYDDYPEPECYDLVDLKEYDRATRQVFLWVSSLFTYEEEQFLQKHFRTHLHPRTLVAYCRSDSHFGYLNDELLENTD